MVVVEVRAVMTTGQCVLASNMHACTPTHCTCNTYRATPELAHVHIRTRIYGPQFQSSSGAIATTCTIVCSQRFPPTARARVMSDNSSQQTSCSSKWRPRSKAPPKKHLFFGLSCFLQGSADVNTCERNADHSNPMCRK